MELVDTADGHLQLSRSLYRPSDPRPTKLTLAYRDGPMGIVPNHLGLESFATLLLKGNDHLFNFRFSTAAFEPINMDTQNTIYSQDTVEKQALEAESRLSSENKEAQVLNTDDGEIFQSIPGQTDFRALGWYVENKHAMRIPLTYMVYRTGSKRPSSS